MAGERRLLARRIANAAISAGGNFLFPGLGSLLEAIYSVTHPEAIEKELAQWRQQTDQNLDRLLEAIFPTIKLSDDASAIAIYLCNSSGKGRKKSELYTINAIHKDFPHLSKEQVEDCVGELLHYGLVSKGPTVQTMITPEYPLFWLFDPISEFGTDPYEDAKTLANEALQEKVFNSRKTIAQLGWSPRRFNPALAYIIEEIGDHFIISNESNPD
ncbi:MAG TPA: hypothetical protein PLV61_09070, partial [Parvularculaceae bacterium]|nr:hypothetical protein [Parvularculaceae bacterium]